MSEEKNKTMLIYPPGDLYQRGEDRCQGNIDKSSATSMRACNDLGYAASVLLQKGYKVFLKDYQTERLSLEDLLADVRKFEPDLLVLSVTNSTIYEDIAVVNGIMQTYPTVITLKGAIFFDIDAEMLDLFDLSNVDFLLGGEIELSIGKIADFALRNKGSWRDIPNIFYKETNGVFQKTAFGIWEQDLDSIPFPARLLMNNKLYTRPDTGEAMATIQTSRGCSASCIYCLSPQISGKKIRYRSPSNIMAELEECYYMHHIRNFFFKADTFTMHSTWVEELCEMIIASPLYKKIFFTANARTHPLNEKTLMTMKKAGCFLVAFGFESGSSETMERIKKGATVEQNLKAAEMARKAKLSFYGFYMIGFPWETEYHLNETKKHILETNPDYLEIHIALPYYGTELYKSCLENHTLKKNTWGSNYFDSNITGTCECDIERLKSFRYEIMKKFYLRLPYILKKLGACIKTPKAFPRYVKYGIRLIKNIND